MAATDEMLQIALRTKPDAVSLVPENPNEITTEGGLDVTGNFENIKRVIGGLKEAGIFVSIFLDPDTEQIEAARSVGAQQVELCTAEYAEMTLSARAAHGDGAKRAADEIERIKTAAQHAQGLGLIVAAGHGITYRNVEALAGISAITEFNIGHNIISRSVFVGLHEAVREMIDAISDGGFEMALFFVICLCVSPQKGFLKTSFSITSFVSNELTKSIDTKMVFIVPIFDVYSSDFGVYGSDFCVYRFQFCVLSSIISAVCTQGE